MTWEKNGVLRNVQSERVLRGADEVNTDDQQLLYESHFWLCTRWTDPPQRGIVLTEVKKGKQKHLDINIL